MALLRTRGRTALALIGLCAGCAVSAADMREQGESPVFSSPDAGHEGGTWPEGAGDAGYAAPAARDAGRDAQGAPLPTDAGEDARAPADDAGSEGARDTGVEGPGDGGEHGDAGASADAGLPRDGAVARPPKSLDGILADEEWAHELAATQRVPTNWGSNQLTYLAAALDEHYLFIAVRGSVENDKNALVVYIDADPDRGVLPSAITDGTGEDQLDDALSTPLQAPADFLAEVAWGTLRMSAVVMGSTAYTGFRGLERPYDLAWIEEPDSMDDPSAYTVCSADACEARIPLTTLGGSGDIRMFARLTNSDGEAFANQTLPFDDASAPTLVKALLTLPR